MIRSALIGGTPLQTGLAGFFTSTVTVLRATNTANAYGEPVPTWAPLLDHVDLDALVAGGDVSVRLKKQEFRMSSMIAESIYRRVLLNGHYPNIDNADRVRIEERDWAVISIVSDVTSTFTELLVESIEPGNV
jgi:head-tail adaptor